MPHAGERVLVFSPHPDDETLGLGGYLHEARRRGADVRVVLLTSGDGFQLCAAAKYRGWPSRKQMRQLATDREAEAYTALSKLGVARDQVSFLGYPDRGLAALWQSNWTAEAPYRSPYTGESAVLQAATHRPFCGEAVLHDTEELLRSFRPDQVLYPDPADDHPDHWAAHCFVQLALERLRDEAWAARTERRTYLIHRGEWPEPLRTDRSLYLSPPTALAQLDNRWESIPLTRENLDAKAAALRAYRSQEALAGNFLNAFLRQNELLVKRPALSGPVLTHAGQEFPDATADRFARARCGAVDFTGIDVESGSDEVRLNAVLREGAAGWPAYYLYWKPVSGAPDTLQTHRYRISGFRCDPPVARFTIEGRQLRVTLPRSELGGSTRIMVAASAWSGPLLLDRTAWSVVDVGAERELTAKTQRTPGGKGSF
jgi:LmbE family N-acetylglucosaminyl deacetylase